MIHLPFSWHQECISKVFDSEERSSGKGEWKVDQPQVWHCLVLPLGPFDAFRYSKDLRLSTRTLLGRMVAGTLLARMQFLFGRSDTLFKQNYQLFGLHITTYANELSGWYVSR